MGHSVVAAFAAVALGATGLTGLAAGSTPAAAFEPSLAFIDCPADAQPVGVECAELTVPLDWANPDDGRTVALAVRIVRAERSRGGLTFNPGGPGGSGIDLGATFYSLLPDQVQARFDFVSWDPRGVGLSGPTINDCPALPSLDLPPTGPIDWEATWTDLGAQMGPAMAACFAANPDAAPYLGTWQVVRDLDALRDALGYPRWNYWGMSYGTRIGYTYARTFPDRLRAMIVDGSLWPQETLLRLSTEQPGTWNTAKEVYASVFGPAQAGRVDQILAALDDEVLVDPGSGVTITRWDFTSYFFNAIAGQASYREVRATVNAIYRALFAPSDRGRGSAIQSAAEAIEAQEIADPTYTFAFIICADLQDRPTPQSLGRIATAIARNYGTTMPTAMYNAILCNGLPSDYSPPLPRSVEPTALPLPPMVVLSTGDPRTAWVWGRTMANQYTASRTISYDSTQHVTYLLTPSDCVNRPVTRYLMKREQLTSDISCPFVRS